MKIQENDEILKNFNSILVTRGTIVEILSKFNVSEGRAISIYKSMRKEKNDFFKEKNICDPNCDAIPKPIVSKYFSSYGLSDEVILKKLNHDN